MGVMTQLFGAAIATIAAGYTIEAPRHLVVKTGIIGVLSYAFNLFLQNNMDLSIVTAYFFACLFASLLSQVFARKLKAPVTMFYIPTFYLYVPGSSIYQMAFHYIEGNYSLAVTFLFETISIAGAIALGVFMSDSLTEIYWDIKNKMDAKQLKD